MSFTSKFRRIQRLGVYTIGYKYVKCSVLKKYVCAHVSLNMEMTCLILPLLQRTDIFGRQNQDRLIFLQSVLAGKETFL